MENVELISPLAARETTIARDLNLNFHRLMNSSRLSPQEGALALLALARAVDYGALALLARERLGALGVAAHEIQEAEESAAMMGMLNTYYKFRSFIEGVGGGQDYAAAGLRMTALAKPVLGKTVFEMLAFSVSVLNGCETCVVSHEKVLREAEVAPEKIHDLARLAAVVKGLKALSETN